MPEHKGVTYDEPDADPYTGFMCLTDFEDELYAASGGNTVYPSVHDLIEARRCVKQCGIVQVRVVAVKQLRDHADYAEAILKVEP